MPDDRNTPNPDLHAEPVLADGAAAAPSRTDPNDEIDVPDMMYPAELDARGDAVNALRKAKGLPVPETHDEDRGASYA